MGRCGRAHGRGPASLDRGSVAGGGDTRHPVRGEAEWKFEDGTAREAWGASAHLEGGRR